MLNFAGQQAMAPPPCYFASLPKHALDKVLGQVFAAVRTIRKWTYQKSLFGQCKFVMI
jgi:hypothetical protein